MCIENGTFSSSIYLYIKDCDFPVRYVSLPDQWPVQEPKLEVPTIYKAYVSYVRGYTPKI